MIKHFTIISLILFFLVFTFVLYPFEASAYVPSGGTIISISTCTNGFMISLGPPISGLYLYPWGSLTYLLGPPSHTKQWLLGLTYLGGSCNKGGINIPTQYTFYMQGSSI